MNNYKVRVYTRPNCNVLDAKAKCIFDGYIPFIPMKDHGIVVREGFCVESIDAIYLDFNTEEIEIHINSMDIDDEYPKVNWRG